MKMIVHEHVGMTVDLVIGEGAPQFVQEDRSVAVVAKDRAAIVAAAGDVVEAAGNQYSQGPGHGQLYDERGVKINSKDLTLFVKRTATLTTPAGGFGK
jgi:hypothetical protein